MTVSHGPHCIRTSGSNGVKDVLRHTTHRATAPRKFLATVKNLVYTTMLHTHKRS